MPSLATQTYARYPANLGQPPVDKWILFEAKSGRHVVRSVLPDATGADRTLASVGLYMSEDALKDTLTLTYNQADLGPFIGTLAELIAKGQNLLNIKPSTSSQDRSSLQARLEAIFSKVSNSLSDIGSTFKDALKADAVQGLTNLSNPVATGAVLGARPNPRTDVQFDSQKYRTHAFTFTLIPRDVSEAQAIDQIVNFFQFYSLPSYRAAANTTQVQIGAFMMGFPYEFVITYRDGFGQELQHTNRVARSVLTQVDIDHAGAGKVAFVRDGSDLYPVVTTISLQFQEVILLARDSPEIQRAGSIDPNNVNFDPRS